MLTPDHLAIFYSSNLELLTTKQCCNKYQQSFNMTLPVFDIIPDLSTSVLAEDMLFFIIQGECKRKQLSQILFELHSSTHLLNTHQWFLWRPLCFSFVCRESELPSAGGSEQTFLTQAQIEDPNLSLSGSAPLPGIPQGRNTWVEQQTAA